jgi:riboflavin synthase
MRYTDANQSHVDSRGTLFTGIIEHQGTIEALHITSMGARLTVHARTVAPSLAISNSIAVNGCCVTVAALTKQSFSADLSLETLQKTSFGAHPRTPPPAAHAPGQGSRVNLEQPLTAGKELGGHFVLGHVDTIGRVAHLQPETSGSESWAYGVEVPQDFARYIVPKGSLTIDGISLTVAHWNRGTRIVEIAVIPYTCAHTNIRDRQPGDAVNLEADILGKYLERYLEARDADASGSPGTREVLTIEALLRQGF